MDEKSLKTKKWQRVGILTIAILMLGSTIAMYMMIIVGGNGNNSNSNSDNSETAELETAVQEKRAALDEMAQTLSDEYLNEMIGYKSEIHSYNAEAANEGGVTTRDLKDGDGMELAEGDMNYIAYYIGYCPNESVFDSSFDNAEDPTKLKTPISGGGLIEGWNEGVVGMKLGGVREISVPSSLAYGEREMCDMTNTPLKFVVMALPKEGDIKTAYDEYDDAYARLMAAYGHSS